jgi:hypothetical protein
MKKEREREQCYCDVMCNHGDFHSAGLCFSSSSVCIVSLSPFVIYEHAPLCCVCSLRAKFAACRQGTCNLRPCKPDNWASLLSIIIFFISHHRRSHTCVRRRRQLDVLTSEFHSNASDIWFMSIIFHHHVRALSAALVLVVKI